MDTQWKERTLELGDLVVALYDAFLDEYGDAELASVATATLIQERLAEGAWERRPREFSAAA